MNLTDSHHAPIRLVPIALFDVPPLADPIAPPAQRLCIDPPHPMSKSTTSKRQQQKRILFFLQILQLKLLSSRFKNNRLTMHRIQIVRQQMFGDQHSSARIDGRRHDITGFLHIRSVAYVKPFQHRIPLFHLHLIQFIIFLLMELQFFQIDTDI